MRTHDGYDARDSYERAWDAMGENVQVGNDDIESNGRRFQDTLLDIVATMRSLIKSQEEQHQLNDAMLQILIDIQRHMSLWWRTAKPKGSKTSTKRRRRSSSRSVDSEGSIEDFNFSSHKEKRKIRYKNISWDEFKKPRPPIHNGEIKNGQEVEAWLLGMTKYSKSRTILEIWRQELPSSIWIEEHPFGGSTWDR